MSAETRMMMFGCEHGLPVFKLDGTAGICFCEPCADANGWQVVRVGDGTVAPGCPHPLECRDDIEGDCAWCREVTQLRADLELASRELQVRRRQVGELQAQLVAAGEPRP